MSRFAEGVVMCPDCEGQGWSPTEEVKCGRCQGLGRMRPIMTDKRADLAGYAADYVHLTVIRDEMEDEPEPLERSQRGFLQGAPVTTTYGAVIRFSESSAVNGPYIWMYCEQPDNGVLDPFDAAAHMTMEQALQVHANLGQMLTSVQMLATVEEDDPLPDHVDRSTVSADRDDIEALGQRVEWISDALADIRDDKYDAGLTSIVNELKLRVAELERMKGRTE